jgi:hypothetical protein
MAIKIKSMASPSVIITAAPLSVVLDSIITAEELCPGHRHYSNTGGSSYIQLDLLVIIAPAIILAAHIPLNIANQAEDVAMFNGICAV